MPRLHTYSRYLPRPAREVLRERVLLPLAVRGLRRAASPSRGLLGLTRIGWGNLGWSPGVPFLNDVVHYARTTVGPVLECGSGLTTLLVLLQGSPHDAVVSLEHEASCHERISTALARWQLSAARVCLLPLRDYGEFTWYDVASVSLPEAIRLVICDGPPRTTPGGRYGLLPVLAAKLSPGCVVLMDDADSESVQETLRRWVEEFHGEWHRLDPGSGVAVYIHR